jgi:hypothetical protein
MTKIVLWIAVIFAVLIGFRLLNVAKGKQRARDAGRDGPQAPPAEAMVRCTRCGVYLPRADATAGPDGLTCGEPGCAQKRSPDARS